MPAGRFEVVARDPAIVVDYAHTPDALARTVETARALVRSSGRVVVVFGAGGQRDVEKRALMGRAAAAADRVIVTSDNPRDEDPGAIAAAVFQGLEGHSDARIELDRRAAIESAVRTSRSGDVILVCGKGHERHQEIRGMKHHLSDHEVIRGLH
jgi:UDP-N-acetylmuramoyl-L-alanyl-D-glutamate--2,6-diaminopimelate ligase